MTNPAISATELEGLQAFEVRVGAYAGHRYPERPLWVELRGARREVASVDCEWREEERFGYLLTLDDATRLLLYYVPDADIWSGLVLQ
jgi:hypothetical protein